MWHLLVVYFVLAVSSMNQITCCFISENKSAQWTCHPTKLPMAPRSIATCYHNSLYWELSRSSLASNEELGRKTPATESSIGFRLCLLCQGDKFTDISGVAAATTSITTVPSNGNHWWTVYNIWLNAKTWVCSLASKPEWRIWRRTEQSCAHSVASIMSWMVKQHTNNIWREIKLDMAKRFYPMSRVYCYATKSVVALLCPKLRTPKTIKLCIYQLSDKTSLPSNPNQLDKDQTPGCHP